MVTVPGRRRTLRHQQALSLMRISRDDITDLTIRQIEPGRLRVGNEVFTRNVALTVEGIIRDWPAKGVDDMQPGDLTQIVALEPEMIVIGAGWRPVLPPKKLVFAMARQGIGIEVMLTPAAARTFNILVAEGRRAAAVLLLDR
jgi:uncharacterized protein